jgi:hypothetical protein
MAWGRVTSAAIAFSLQGFDNIEILQDMWQWAEQLMLRGIIPSDPAVAAAIMEDPDGPEGRSH